MQWDDYMGWDIDNMTKMYGVREYMYEPVMGSVDANQSLTEQEMVDLIYNQMDVFILPTGGEGFAFPAGICNFNSPATFFAMFFPKF